MTIYTIGSVAKFLEISFEKKNSYFQHVKKTFVYLAVFQSFIIFAC